MQKMKNKLFQAAIYVRLSDEDGDFSILKKSESNSISNQKQMLYNFVKNKPDIMVIKEYSDDGYTGTNFERPGFQAMMEAVRSGIINCIIVKDLSRFGRDYVEVGRYIEKIFPQLGIRFISVNDSYDSITNEWNIVLPIQNLMNDSYSKDISMKTRSNLEIMRKEGDFIGSFPVYGYLRSSQNKHKLEVDNDAAKIIQDIFKWKISGFSADAIAKRLNALGILSPMEYKKSIGSRFQSSFKTGVQAKWSHNTVRRILKNEIYTGVLVQGKVTTPNYKVKKRITKEKEDWVRVEGTHEPIIARPQFDLVQQLLEEDTRAAKKEYGVYLYSGKIFCADCGGTITRKVVKAKDKIYTYYICSTHKKDKKLCTSHKIKEEMLNKAVLATIQAQISVILNIEKTMQDIEALSWEKREIEKIESNIRFQRALIEKNNKLTLDIYTDLKEGMIDETEFYMFKEEFSTRIQQAQSAIKKYQETKNAIIQGLSNQQSWLAQFRKYANIKELDRKVITNLIEKIYVFENEEIEVVFRQKDQLYHLLEFIENHKSSVSEEAV